MLLLLEISVVVSGRGNVRGGWQMDCKGKKKQQDYFCIMNDALEVPEI